MCTMRQRDLKGREAFPVFDFLVWNRIFRPLRMLWCRLSDVGQPAWAGDGGIYSVVAPRPCKMGNVGGACMKQIFDMDKTNAQNGIDRYAHANG